MYLWIYLGCLQNMRLGMGCNLLGQKDHAVWDHRLRIALTFVGQIIQFGDRLMVHRGAMLLANSGQVPLLSHKPEGDNEKNNKRKRFDTQADFSDISLPANLPNETKDFIGKLIRKNPDQRMSAEEALAHDLITKYYDQDLDDIKNIHNKKN